MTEPGAALQLPSDGLRFGVDIGGTGIKGAPVDLAAGRLAGDRFKLPTPRPATPGAVADVVGEVVAHFGWTGPVGCAFPAVIKNGIARTAANVDHSWIGASVEQAVADRLGTPESTVTVVNDADAAGVAELAFGAGRDRDGVVVLLTLGTGIGSAVFLDGVLVPNTELGHLELDGVDAETRASAVAREREDLSWQHWAKRLSHYLQMVENLLWPDLIILGGGVSRKPEKFVPLLECRTEVVPAQLANDAGIVGAALIARDAVTAPARLGAARPEQRNTLGRP
jgi:polyphosphate glucokinase